MRLTNEIRENILNSECQERFTNKTDKLREEIRKHVEQIIMKRTEELNKKYNCDFLQLAQDGFINLRQSVTIKNERYSTIDLNITYPDSRLENFQLPLDKFITSRRESIKEIDTKRAIFRDDLSKILYSFNTDNQLLENVPYLKKYFTEKNMPQTLLPIPIEQIQKMNQIFKGK